MTEQIAQQMYDALAKAFTALDKRGLLRAKERDEVLEEAAHALALWEERDWSMRTEEKQQ